MADHSLRRRFEAWAAENHSSPSPEHLAVAWRAVQALAGDGPQYRAAPARFILLELAEHCTGYTVRAMRRKMESGMWLEGREYRKAPDGRIHVDLQGYERWVMSRGGEK